MTGADRASRVAARAERGLAALVAVSSPSGDVDGAEECFAVAAALAPEDARLERVPCSSPDHAPDAVLQLAGEGTRRLLLLGHVDTVTPHDAHHPLATEGERLTGSGAVDMKGGVALALGVMAELAAGPRDAFAEVALLLVGDEEWRTHAFGHAERFAGYDACLCFEAGAIGPGGEEAVIVRRKAAGTLRVTARGRAAHSGSAPDAGINALLALTTVAQAVAAAHDPMGSLRLTAVPTVIRAGEAFNVVPATGELLCDLRADELGPIEATVAGLPREVAGAEIEVDVLRAWPGMDTRAATADLLGRASQLAERPILAGARGGASDASHFAGSIPVTLDGLGPRGGGAHTPGEFVLRPSLAPRAAVALAVAEAALGVA